jgi:amino acid adenylation domain-containing protein
MMAVPTGTAHAAGEAVDPGAEALWLLQHLAPDRGVSNVALAIEFDRPPRWWPLREAVRWLVRRHRALQASFPERAGVPVRRYHPPDEVTLEIDMVASDAATVDADLREYVARPFDLESPPLLRVGVLVVAPDRQIVCVVVHHIAVDGTGLAVLADELAAAYQALAGDGEPPAVPVSAAGESAPIRAESVAHWRRHVTGFDASGMRLEGAREPGPSPSFAGHLVERALSPAAVRAVATLRQSCRATDAIVLLAAYYAALRRHGAASDEVVGVTTDTRGARAGGAVGCHVATLPLRVEVVDDLSFAELVSRVTQVMVAGLEHSGVPFELLTRDDVTGVADSPAWWRARLVRCLFSMQPRRGPEPRHAEGADRAAPPRMWGVTNGLSRFDMELYLRPVTTGLSVELMVSTEVYDAAFAEAFVGRFDVLLQQAALDPSRPIGDIDIRTDADRRVVEEANRTEVDWPAVSVLDLVGEAAARRPSAVAVVDAAATVTYAGLLSTAAAVRDDLLRQGCGPGEVVAIAAPRGAGVAAAVLGVWATGAAYLPLDPDHPAPRLAYQLADSGCRWVIGDDLPAECRAGRTVLPVPRAGGDAVTAVPYPTVRSPEDPAYLIYTSGSTGQPTGVVLSHRNLANVVRHFATRLPVGAEDSTLWLTTFAFDISALELFLPLVAGGRVVLCPDELRAQPQRLIELVERADVSIVQATPTTWRLAAPHARGRLTGRTVLCGGEPMSAALARQLRATGARVLNVYGPTETTIWSTVAEVPDTGEVTIGTPIANTRAFVLGARGGQQPVGLTGELCLAGEGVATGYHARPELNARRFRSDPVLGRHHRTGDLARWRPDRTLELLGRVDRQVKLRGRRIELGEVEAALETHPAVAAAAVVLHGDPSSDGQLVAFVVAPSRPGIDAEIWAHAARELPRYSVPSRVVALPQLPTTANGKTDTRALVERAAAGDAATGPAPVDGDPVGRVEATLVRLWRTTLARPDLGRDANFFLSGGNSLAAVQLATAATDQCGSVVTMAMVFQAPTPAALARLVEHVPEPAP